MPGSMRSLESAGAAIVRGWRRARSLLERLRALPGPALALVLLAGGCAEPEGSRPSIRCLHATGEHYRAFAWLLCSHLERTLGHAYEISLQGDLGDGHHLTGAMDIIDTIARHEEENSFKLGLTQSDVAHYFRHGGHPLYEFPHIRRDRVVALARVFPEYLHVYSSVAPVPEPGASEASRSAVLLDDLERSWQTLYLGALGSGTLITSVNVLPVLAERPLHPPPGDLTQRHELLPQAGAEASVEPWGGTYVSGVPAKRIEALLSEQGGTLLSLKPAQQRHLHSVFSMLYRDGELVYETPGGATVRARAVEVPALLVSSARLPRDVALAVRELIERPGESAEHAIGRDRIAIDPPEGLDPATVQQVVDSMAAYERERDTDLLLPAHRRIGVLHTENYRWPLAILLASIACLIPGVRLLHRSWRRGSGWLELPVWTSLGVAASFAFAWLSFAVLAVLWLEYGAFITYKVDRASPFLTEPFGDLVPRILYYVASGFSYDAIFPASWIAQMFWLSIPLALVFSALAGMVRALLPKIVELIGRARERRSKMALKGHIVLCNWHPHAEKVVRMLCDHARLEKRPAERVVVATEDPDRVEAPRLGELRHEVLGECTEFAIPPPAGESEERFAKFLVVRGDPREGPVIQTLRVAQAKAVILFPHPGHVEPDSSTLLLVVKIRKEIDEGVAEGAAGPKLIAWCEDSKNADLFLNPKFGLTDVCSAEWAWRMMCQATYVDHVSDIYRRLLTSTEDTNEIYELEIPDGWQPVPFGDLQSRLAVYNRGVTHGRQATAKTADGDRPILLLGYSRPSERNGVRRAGTPNADGASDRRTWEERRDDGLHLNPDPGDRVEVGDRLLLLAFSFGEAVRERVLAGLSREETEPASGGSAS